MQATAATVEILQAIKDSAIVFSESTIDRADRLNKFTDMRVHRYSGVLAAIEGSGFFAEVAIDLAAKGVIENLDCYLKSEKEYQAELLLHSIVDDRAAIAFLDRIEPELQAWDRQFAELRDRHEKEISTFLESIR